MRYTVEITDYGVTVYSAVQPDYDHELQVRVSPSNLICNVAMHPTPAIDTRDTISKLQFETALGTAKKTFNDYLKMNP